MTLFNRPLASPLPSQKNHGFTLIELMIVIMIMTIISVVSVISYLRYFERNAMESAARSLKDFIRQTQDNAKKGAFSSKTWNEGKNVCYITYDTAENWCGADSKTGRYGTNGLTNDGNYSSCLEMVATSGIMLESWGVRARGRYDVSGKTTHLCADNDECDTVEMVIDCRYRQNPFQTYIYTYNFASYGLGSFDMLGETPYRKNFAYKNLVEQTLILPSGVNIAQDFYFEFEPFYLNVQYPLVTDKDSNSKTYGEKIVNVYYETGQGENAQTPFFAAPNEIVLTMNYTGRDESDNDQYEYLYKIPIAVSGSLGDGCFCNKDPKILCSECINE